MERSSRNSYPFGKVLKILSNFFFSEQIFYRKLSLGALVTVVQNREPLATRLVLKFRNGFDTLGVINSKLTIFSVALI